MQNYKAPDNSVHFLNSTEFEYLLPSGSMPITDEEAEALRPKPSAKDITLAQIQAIESATPFTHRHLRDITDLMVQAIKQANPAVDLSQIPGIAAVAQVEAQIAALRSQLK